MNHYICDNYLKRGHTMETYMNAAKELDDNTEFVKLKFENATILHLVDKKDKKLIYKELIPGNVFQTVGNGVLALANDVVVNGQKIIDNMPGFFPEISEKNTTAFRFVSYNTDDFYFIGETLYKTFGARISDISGKLLRSNTIERDIALSAVLLDDCFTCQGLVRQYGNVKKLMAIYSDRFKRVPMTFFGECLAELQKQNPFYMPEVKYWDISNMEVNLYVEFPELVKQLGADVIIPGVKFTTSDTGYKQTVVTACWRNVNGKVENHYIQREFTMKHSTEVLMSDIFEFIEEAVSEQKMFYQKYQDYKSRLRQVPVDGKRAFKKAVKELMGAVDYKKLLGAEVQNYLINTLCERYIEKLHTKEEILDVIIQFPEKMFIGDACVSQREKMRKALIPLVTIPA